MDEYDEIAINELGLKSRSKREVYNLLWNEGGIYLPPLKDSHHKFISQIMVGDKKFLKCSQVKVCTVPHYKMLTIPDMLKFAKTKVDINLFLPDYEYQKYPNRQWLWNVLNTVLGDDFKKFVNEKIQERVKHVIWQKRMTVKALPEFIAIFKNSKNISVHNGRTNHLLRKFGKRKWDQMESDDKEKLKEAEAKLKNMESTIEKLENKVKDYMYTQESLLQDKEKLCKLYEEGYIDSDGEIKN